MANPEKTTNSSPSPEKESSVKSDTYVTVQILHDDSKDESSDELVIDLSHENYCDKVKSRKRKCTDMSDSSEDERFALPENYTEIDEKVSAVAAKNNLTAENIKKIIKRVVLNEHVLAIVKIREEEMQKETKKEIPIAELSQPKLKLTRAKTKELKKTIPSTFAWPLPITTPVKLPKFQLKHDVESLISQELPDEESDDEYYPTQEEPTDDERDNLESSSDIDSQPQTPAELDVSFCEQSINKDTSENSIKYTDDGIFKIPKEVEKKLVDQEEATIARRTRSKLCLSDTPIEQIEESFEPPDVSLDDVVEADNDWRDFIYDLPNLEPSNNKDDDETDPEYNVAADYEPFDNEEDNEDDEVEVSKKELDDLVSELLEGMGGDYNFDESSFGFNTDLVSLLGPNTDLTPISVPKDTARNDVNVSPMKILEIGKWKSDYNPIENSANSVNVEKSDGNLNISTYDISDIRPKVKIDYNQICEKATEKSSNEADVSPDYQKMVFSVKQINSMENGVPQYSYIVESDPKSNSEPIGTVNVQNQTCISQNDIIVNSKRKKAVFELPSEYNNWIFKESDVQILPEQRLILDQQMRQHVQLVTQCFLQVHGHPKFWKYGPQQKEYLMTLKYLGNDNTQSAFIPCNLLPAIELCNNWANKLAEDTPEMAKMMEFINKENEKMIKRRKAQSVYYGKFTMQYAEAVLKSKVFIYPSMLPSIVFRVDKHESNEYLPSEEQLIVLGLEQFYPYIIANDNVMITSDNLQLNRVTCLISKYMMPCRRAVKLKSHIKQSKWRKNINPIKEFFLHKKVAKIIYRIISFDPEMCPLDHPVTTLPYVWQKHCKTILTQKSSHTVNKQPTKAKIAITNTPSIRLEIQKVVPKSQIDNQKPEKSSESTKEDSPLPPNQTIITDYFLKPSHLNPEPELEPELEPATIQQTVQTTRLKHLLWLCHTFIPSTNLNRIQSNFLHLIKYISEKMLPSMPFLSTNSKDCTDANDTPKDPQSKECVILKMASEEKMSGNCRSSNKPSVPVNSARQRLAAKAKRELEVNKAMFLRDEHAEDIRDTMYAAAFFDKVKLRLSNHALDSSNVSKFEMFQRALNDFNIQNETPCDLYRKLEELFGAENADLTEEFLTFLTPGQATEVGRFTDYFLLFCMIDFIQKLQIFFANKPAQLRKIYWCLERLTERSNSELTLESVKNVILPLLKGNQYLIDWFLKLFPEEKPPESLTNSSYEVIDFEKIANDDIGESTHEVLNIPHINENYGNDQCTCKCHNSANEKYKNRTRHCLACGTKYIQGRMFVQHGRALRPIHLDWHENIHGHLDQTRRLSASAQPIRGNSRKRAASLEHLPTTTRTDSDDDRVSPKRNAKCLRTPTSKTKKSMHLSKTTNKTNDNDQTKASCSKNIIKDSDGSKLDECKNSLDVIDVHPISVNSDDHFETFDEFARIKKECCTEKVIPNKPDLKIIEETVNERPLLIKSEIIDIEIGEEDSEYGDGRDLSTIKSEVDTNWTREEDKVILVILRSETRHDLTLSRIKQVLPHRSEAEIRDRFQNLVNLLQKIASAT